MSIWNSKWLHHLVGLDTAHIPDDAALQLIWVNMPRSWRVFILLGLVAAVVYLVLWIYRRETAHVSPRLGRILAALRIAVVLLLVAIFLGPAITYTERRVLYPLVVLLRDDSQSMRIKDAYQDDASLARVARATGQRVDRIRRQPPRRADLVQELLEKENAKILSNLQQKGRVQIANFASQVTEVETLAAQTDPESGLADSGNAEPARPTLPPLSANGLVTDLHRALDESFSDRMTSALIVFTDGQHTAAPTEADQLPSLADRARQQELPIYFVGVGDPTRARNLQVTDVYADAQVWTEDPFEIQAVLRASGIGNQTVQLELIELSGASGVPAAAPRRVIGQQDVAISADGQVKVAFTHTPSQTGRFGYTVRATPVENELNDEDNTATPIEVKVLKQQARVLLIAGSPTWEYRNVQRLLQRTKSIQLSCWLQTLDDGRSQEGDVAISSLPNSRQSLAEYDVIMLFDPNPGEFSREWIDLVREFVNEHSGGLLYMAGPKYSGSFLAGPRTAPLGHMLPVDLGDVKSTEVAMLLNRHNQAWKVQAVEANANHPILRFLPTAAESLEVWRRLPGIFWSFPSQAAKPGTRVLLEHSNPSLRTRDQSRPLLVSGQYGAGRTIFVGFNGTWRWRSAGSNAEFFNRLWIQTTRFLIEGRSLEGKRRGFVETDRSRYAEGDLVSVQAELKDEALEPLTSPHVAGKLEVPGQDPIPMILKRIHDQPGHYEATLVAKHAGRHLISVDMSEGSPDAPTIETTFSVSTQSREWDQVWLNKPLLVDLAHRSGGRYFDVDQLDELVAAIPDRRRNLETQAKPLPLWDTNRVLLILVAFLSMEWGIRKRFRLL